MRRKRDNWDFGEFVDAARAAHETKENYLDALFSYQGTVFRLENAAGQIIH